MDIFKLYKEELLNAIPVTSGIDLDILKIEDQSITLSAPLVNNVNYEGTAFGGSINTLCILSCYLLVHHVLKINKVVFKSLVIQDSSIKYIKPVDGNFNATSTIELKDEKLLIKLIQRKGVGRISVRSEICTDGSDETKVVFHGRFVASI